jgi:hypothetical protein
MARAKVENYSSLLIGGGVSYAHASFDLKIDHFPKGKVGTL